MANTLAQSYDPELPVEWIRPHPDNPNQGDEEALADSIERLGFFGAILVRQTDEYEYELIGGEHRWRKVCADGGKTIPALVVHDIDDETALRMLLVDNEITRRGRYDNTRLTKVLRSLPDLRGTGFPADILSELTAAEETRARKETAARVEAKEFVREYGLVIECPDEASQEELYEKVAALVDPSRIRAVSI
jgi:GNAT superfamily N-acetyltransferase